MGALENPLTFPDLGNLTATAVLGWYAWHTVSRTIPELLHAFRAELGIARQESRLEREALYAELAAEREQRHEDHLAIVRALNDLANHWCVPTLVVPREPPKPQSR